MDPHRPSRRILVITGAGASTNLGVDRPLPLMQGWATSLVQALGYKAEQIGLSPDMPGSRFEQALGDFLAFRAALPTVQPFLHLNSGANMPMGVGADIQSWYNRVAEMAESIRKAIWADLFANFGLDRVDVQGASKSYQDLHRLLRRADGDGAESYIAHATTNYDAAIEVALDTDPRSTPISGFVPGVGGGRDYYAPNLLSEQWQTTDQIPVLHIHGAVGWYFSSDGLITRAPADDPYDDRKIPALLLPDSTKNPDLFDAPIRSTWKSFEGLVTQATHILFVGHSLHDAHIVRVVRASGKPAAVLAFVKDPNQGRYSKPDLDETATLLQLLPDVQLISGQFGQRAEWPDLDVPVLERWLLTTTRY